MHREEIASVVERDRAVPFDALAVDVLCGSTALSKASHRSWFLTCALGSSDRHGKAAYDSVMSTVRLYSVAPWGGFHASRTRPLAVKRWRTSK